MSDLVGYPNCWSSHAVAHIDFTCAGCSQCWFIQVCTRKSLGVIWSGTALFGVTVKMLEY